MQYYFKKIVKLAVKLKNIKIDMNKIIGIFSLGIFVTLGCTSNKPSKTSLVEQKSILQIGNKSIPTSEFKYVYNKNNANSADAYSQKSLSEYMDLYTKFRLKVKEAEDTGLDTTQAFKSELNGYKKQLATPYLTEKSVTEALVKQAFSRSQEEVKASHILIKVSPEAEPKDSLLAYNRIMDVRKKALSGESFEALAKTFSEDPSAQMNSGNLGYFTALQMVYPFEDGAYNTAVGQVSMPVRTRFGYHIIKVADKRKSKGEIKVAHLMVRFSAGGDVQDSLAAAKKATELYSRIEKGEDWGKLVNEFSDDMNSRPKNGELPAFSTGNMIPTFEEAAFKLEKIGDISKPVQTAYGFHLIKLLEKKEPSTFEQAEATLKSKVSKDSRSDLSKTYLINRLKRENRFVENTKGMEIAKLQADSTLVLGAFEYKTDKKENTETIFSISEKKYSVNDFLAYLKTKAKKKNNVSPKHYMSLLYKDYTNDMLTSYEENNLDSKYEDYRMLVKEYRDGILLFQLMDSKVWTKAVEDTAGLKKFYEENKQNYRWGKRCDAQIFNAKDASIIEKIKPRLNSFPYEVTLEFGNKIIYTDGKFSILPADKKKIDAIKNILGRDKNYRVEVSASASALESAKSKKSISKARIDAFWAYLKSIGVDSTKVIFNDLGVSKSTDKKMNNEAKYLSFRYVSTNIKSFEKEFNQTDPLALQIKESRFQKGDDAILDGIEWKNEFTQLQKNDRNYLIFIKNILEPQNKTFEEAKGQVISDYQTYLEKQWIESLRKKYPVVVNQAELNGLIKK
ncbi:MAG: peptidylprolyl isomerase [Bacteroidetes bacterium]|nr:MAG: peptidylprolyl isomerase [Bacteroidota bacterium]